MDTKSAISSHSHPRVSVYAHCLCYCPDLSARKPSSVVSEALPVPSHLNAVCADKVFLATREKRKIRFYRRKKNCKNNWFVITAIRDNMFLFQRHESFDPLESVP